MRKKHLFQETVNFVVGRSHWHPEDVLTREEKVSSCMVCIFFLGDEFFYQESCDKHVLIYQKRFISERGSTLDSGEDGLGHLSVLIHAEGSAWWGGGNLAPWAGRSTAVPGTGPLTLSRAAMTHGVAWSSRHVYRLILNLVERNLW